MFSFFLHGKVTNCYSDGREIFGLSKLLVLGLVLSLGISLESFIEPYSAVHVVTT